MKHVETCFTSARNEEGDETHETFLKHHHPPLGGVFQMFHVSPDGPGYGAHD